MSRVRVHNFAVSLDGYGSGDGLSFDAPFGHGAALMDWFKETRSFRSMLGLDGGSTGVDDEFASKWGPGIGVEIMGRGKFTPERGPWNEEWRGWWGEEPPFHTPCIVLTHHPRPPLRLAGTTFEFLDAGPEEALERARELAPSADVRIGGGATTVREFLAADLIDSLHVVVVPILLGRGSQLWRGLEGVERRFERVSTTAAPSGVIHLVFER